MSRISSDKCAMAAQPKQPRRFPDLPILCALSFTVAAAYANSLHGPFIDDDLHAIVANDHIRSIFPLSQSMTAPPLNELVGRPIICLSFAINYALGGLNPLGYHVVNVAAHIACAILLFLLTQITLRGRLPFSSSPGTPGEGRGGSSVLATRVAAAIALLWSLHPIQTESVNYITQRTEVFESMFLLLTLYAVARSAFSPRPLAWIALAIIACALGMGCKEQMVVAPLLAMLYIWCFLPNQPGRHRATLLLVVGLFLTWIILPIELIDADWDSKSGYGLKYMTRIDYLQTQVSVIFHYFRLCLWPSGLVIDYTNWPVEHSFLSALPGGLLIVLALLASAYGCLRKHWAGFLGAWFFLNLGPTSSFLPNFTEIAAERRMYLPSAAVIVCVTIAIWRIVSREKFFLPIVATLAVTLGLLTILRNQVYQSSISIWTDAATKRPDNWHAHYFLSRSYAELNDWNHAWPEDQLALQLEPRAVGPQQLRDLILQSSPALIRPDKPASLPDHPAASKPSPPE